jgi:Integrase core domain
MPSYAASTSGAPVSGWHGSCATPAWSVHARRRWRRGRPDTAPAPDLVNRRFDPPGPDRLWAADVTQFRTGQGWLYLAGVIDLYSRRVVGWAMSDRPDTDLVTDALMMAFPRRRPDRRVVHHSDRGAVLYVAGVQPPAHRAQPGPVLQVHRRRPRQRRSRGLLGHPQTRARLDPPAHNLVHPDRATHRRVRPHRGVLQPRAHPTPPRPPQPPPPTRRPPPPLETPCPPNRGKTTSAPKGLGGVWSAGRGRV